MSVVGFCDAFTRVIFLDRNFWNFHKDNEKMREALLFHELGHCDLNRSHGVHGTYGNYSDYEKRKPYFSFMNVDLLDKLLIPNLAINTVSGYGYGKRCSKEITEEYMRRGEYLPNCKVELELYHYEYVLNNDLDRAFEVLNRELFSIQNSAEGVLMKVYRRVIISDNDSIFEGGYKYTTIYWYEQFESLVLPMIKHLTIGPAIAPTVDDFYDSKLYNIIRSPLRISRE